MKRETDTHIQRKRKTDEDRETEVDQSQGLPLPGCDLKTDSKGDWHGKSVDPKFNHMHLIDR